MTSFSSSTTATLPARPHSVRSPLRWPAWLGCLALSALWFGCTAWLRPLAIPDEGRYVAVAWEMLHSGDVWVPTLNGLPFFHKPPLFYWITAASMSVFGPGVAAARMAPWLASIALVTGLFVFVRRWVGPLQAGIAAVVLATAPLFYGAAQYANMDLLVAACIAAAILLTAHAALARSAGGPYRGALAAAFVAAALGVLAKGLIGVALPVMVLALWGLVTRRVGKVLTLLTWGPGWMIFALVVAPWFIEAQQRFPDFGHYFFIVQHVQRFVSTGFNNVQPWWFYPAALLALTLPWSPWLAAGWRRSADPLRDPRVSDVRALMLAWLAVVLVFFSLPSSKPVGYILPALPPLAYLIAEAVRQVAARRRAAAVDTPRGAAGRVDRRVAATALGAALACLAFTGAAHFFQPKSQQGLATQLRALKQAGESVFFLDNYYYDVAFYARLEAPVVVVDPWLPADVAKDSWRRELVDAGRFVPDRAAQLLLRPAAFDAALCAARVGWLVGPWPAPSDAPAWLAARAPAYQSGHTALWRLDAAEPALRSALRSALRCATPHA